jgi:hypothetical protein
MSYTYKLASYSFTCPVTGTKVYKGDNVAIDPKTGKHISIEALKLIEDEKQ